MGEERLARFASALVTAMAAADETQQSLADALGGSQATVSAWCRGVSEPWPARVFAIERALGVAAGQLSQALGYVPVGAPVSVAVAIEADPSLSESDRTILRTVLRALGDRSG
jgi:transcriptional regulator with XRE-family HTH domain